MRPGQLHHTPSFAEPTPAGTGRCLRCDHVVTAAQFLDEPCPGVPTLPEPPEAPAPCQCAAHACTPPAVQTDRYPVAVGPGPAGVILLCAACYIGGHMAQVELHREASRARLARVRGRA